MSENEKGIESKSEQANERAFVHVCLVRTHVELLIKKNTRRKLSNRILLELVLFDYQVAELVWAKRSTK